MSTPTHGSAREAAPAGDAAHAGPQPASAASVAPPSLPSPAAGTGPPSAGSAVTAVAGSGTSDGGPLPLPAATRLGLRAVSAPGIAPGAAPPQPDPLRATRSVSAAFPGPLAGPGPLYVGAGAGVLDDVSPEPSPPRAATADGADAGDVDALFLGAAMRQPPAPDPLHGLIEFQYLALPHTNAVYGSSTFADSSENVRCVACAL